MKNLKIFNFLVNYQQLYKLAHKYNSLIWVGFWVFSITGFYLGLYKTPADIDQGDAFRIIYVHVPAAILSLMIYLIMTICASIYLIFRIKIFDTWAFASAPVGMTFTLIALVTGSIWGKPMWGTWWIWDARLTSELILFFIYISIILLRQSLSYLSSNLVSQFVSLLIIIGFLDIPIIHFSVNWWNTLHQGPTITKLSMPSIDFVMLWPLILVYCGFLCYYCAISLERTIAFIQINCEHQEWLRRLKI